MPSIAIIGAGNMGASMLGGLIANQFPAKQLWITDSDPQKLKVLQDQFAINTSVDNLTAVKAADVIILAIKPQLIADVAKEIASQVRSKQSLIISVAAGIRVDTLQEWLGPEVAIVRCMPNTPALIRCGATALFANSFVSQKEIKLAESVLQAVGLTVWLEDEKQMDAVTAVSGSGPAYFFLLIEAMQEAGIKLGLSAETSRALTLQTALGAAQMAIDNAESARQLRQRVTSPGGTTEAAIRSFEENQFEKIVNDALTSAKKRSEELALLFGKENN